MCMDKAERCTYRCPMAIDPRPAGRPDDQLRSRTAQRTHRVAIQQNVRGAQASWTVPPFFIFGHARLALTTPATRTCSSSRPCLVLKNFAK